ncbi:MAG: heme NO-binding domain-containing protein, partial [Acidimicrobiia bacterium]
LEGAYTTVGNYPDEDLLKLVAAASDALKISGDDVVRWFGREGLPLLYGLYPQFFEGHNTALAFVLTLNNVIHPEVRKLFPGAYVPDFKFQPEGEDALTFSYESHRRLCSFAEGLLEGAAAHYDQTVEIEQIECQKRGDPRCVIHCRFSKRAA